ncbi:hypothetical protein SAMN05878482_104205 [Peribacillus simplex]|uniref:Uncharacterized protein n=1 Tax=Peribacillus simplex TaxID=1478 RepID=A0A9X8RA79_9BACI|nr:hypothetical protein SAMN05878482_104205 [Peribacillus simplex]
MVILEFTGLNSLEKIGILYILSNPIISHQANTSGLRKVKTYAIDANQLSAVFQR